MATEDRSKMSVVLTSCDMKRSVAFYCDMLGFELKEAWPDRDNPQWGNLMLNGRSVMIGAAMDPATVGKYRGGDVELEASATKAATDFQKYPSGVGLSVCVMVDDIGAYIAQCRERGLQIKGEPKSQFYGIRDITTDDPNG